MAKPLIPPVLNRSICIVCLALTFVHSAALGEIVTIDQVRSAWESRRERIKSFHYEYELEKRVPTEAPGAGAASREKTPGSDGAVRKTVSFSLSGDKMAYRFHEQSLDRLSDTAEATGDTTFRTTKLTCVAFDSACCREVSDLDGSGQFLGTLTTAGEPSDMLTAHVNTAGIWMWFSPLVRLEKVGYAPNKMAISRRQVRMEGRDLVEVAIPRSDGPARCLVYMDPSRDFVPVKLIAEKQGAIHREMSIQYVSDDRVGWRVSSWNDTLKKGLSFKVTRCLINEPLEDGAFTLEYPPGTLVIENPQGMTKYFVVLEDGERRYMSQQEWGEISKKRKAKRTAHPSPDAGASSSRGWLSALSSPAWWAWVGLAGLLCLAAAIFLFAFIRSSIRRNRLAGQEGGHHS